MHPGAVAGTVPPRMPARLASFTRLAALPRWLAPLLALAACGLVASTWHYFGHTWDEPEHIAVGLTLIDRNEYLFDDQHPPLARLMGALGPYLAGARPPARAGIDPALYGEETGRQILYHSTASYDTLLTLARAGMLPFLALLVLAFWHWMRRDFGEQMALVGSGFLLTTPVLMGHAGVMALDMPVTATCVLGFACLVRWVEAPTLARAASLGLATGLAVSTKLSALPFLAVAGLALLAARVVLAHRAGEPYAVAARLKGAGLAFALCVAVAIASYGPHLVYLTNPTYAPNPAIDFLVGSSGRLHDVAYELAARVRVPLGVQEFTDNFIGVTFHNTHGHQSYLLGQTGLMGWWYFYPVALAVKTPIPLLVLGLAGLTLLARQGWSERSVARLAPPFAFAAILGFCMAYSHINIGVRHVMVLYPLLAIGAAAAVLEAWRRWAQPAARAGIAVLVAWQLATMVVAYPDYLAYFNAIAGAHPERILVDSDLDWGQDLKRLSQELARRQVPFVSIAYMGSADLTLEHLPPFKRLGPGDRATGWVAVDMLSLKERRQDFDWLAGATPVARVGQSIDLYFIAPR